LLQKRNAHRILTPEPLQKHLLGRLRSEMIATKMEPGEIVVEGEK
jgi:hypothetical protein